MRHTLPTLCAACLVLFACLPLPAEEKPVAPGAPRLLPEKTLAYLRIENVTEFREELATSATGRMLADPKLKPIASEVYVAASDLFEQLGRQLGLSLDDLLAIPTGQLAVALFPVDGDGVAAVKVTVDEPQSGPKDESPEAIRKRLGAQPIQSTSVSFGGLIVIETGDDDKSLRKVLATVEQKLTESGSVVRREIINGTSLLRIIRVSDPSKAIEYFSRDGVTVIGIGAGTGAAALARWNGESSEPTLAESTDFAGVMSRCIGAEETRPQITFYIDPYRIVERAVKGSGGPGALVWPIVENLGVGKIRGIGGSVFQGGEMFDDITHIHVLLDPPRDGIFSVVRPSKGDTNPPDWVPDDVASYMSLNWRVDKTFDGVERIFDTFTGKGSFDSQVVEPFQKATELDLRESLVNSTTDRGVMITWLQHPVTFFSRTFLFAVQLKDPAATVVTLEKLRSTIAKRTETDMIGATKVYRGRQRRQNQNLPATVRTPEPCAAIVGDWILFSDSRKLLEHVIRANSGSLPRLSSLPEYDLVASELGAQLGSERPFMLSFSRNSDLLREFYDVAKAPNIKDFVRSRGEQNPVAKRIGELMEKNELPPFDEFKKYFAPSGSFGYDEPTGIHFGRYTLKAE